LFYYEAMKSQLTFEQKYQQLGQKDNQYDGLFFTAVKTTGIFCHPSCRARTPKAENVIFYDDVQTCLENGYRPCKICKPLEQIGEVPDFIKSIMVQLQKNPQDKISDEDLKQQGIEPHTIRRWYKKHHGMTFHAFQRMFRINYAFNHIKKGKSITTSAFDSGYDSLSGFNQSFQTIFGQSANKSKHKNVINVARIASPIGALIACASEKGVCFLGFVGQKHLERNFALIEKHFKAVILPTPNPHLNVLEKELKEYFAGKRQTFEVPLDIIGTEFQQKVWQALVQIPYGQTSTYKQQAISIDKLKAIRAVATANGANKISIIIPCHRIIGSDGSLTGYAGGLHRKRWLLDFESIKYKILLA